MLVCETAAAESLSLVCVRFVVAQAPVCLLHGLVSTPYGRPISSPYKSNNAIHRLCASLSSCPS